MRKAVSLVILFISLFTIYQFGINFIKQTHSVSYQINNGRSFEIVETFKNNSYYFLVKTDNYNFFYKDSNLFNKMKNVIKNIEYKEDNGMLCIYPVYEKTSSQIICSDFSREYTYESTTNKTLSTLFYDDLKKNGYKFKIDDDVVSMQTTTKEYIDYYSENFKNNETIVAWTYDGFNIFNNMRGLEIGILTFDRYDNVISTMVDKYYVTPLYKDNKLYEFNKLYVHDVINNNNYEVNLGMYLSNYTYINGVVDDSLYLTDPENVVQIKIDVKKSKVEVVGNKDKNGLYYDGKFSKKNIYDFVSENIKFKFDDNELSKKYQYQYVLENSDSYYFYTGSELYQVYKDNLDIPILIVANTELKNIKLKNETLYYIYSDTVYKYENNYFIKPMIKYNELVFNGSNMYDVYN